MCDSEQPSISVSASEWLEVERSKMLSEAKADLTQWAKSRLWIITLISVVAGAVGIFALVKTFATQAITEGSYGAIATKTVHSDEYRTIIQNTAIPVGTIIPFAGDVDAVPQGWLLCDGSPLEHERYDALRKVLGPRWGSTLDENSVRTYHLPDLRGMFLRGVDDPDGVGGKAPAGRDPGATTRVNSFTDQLVVGGVVGSVQDDAFEKHKHYVSRTGKLSGSENKGKEFTQAEDHTGSHETGVTGSGETRPKNAYVNFIIRY